jgi:hypothetical protein
MEAVISKNVVAWYDFIGNGIQIKKEIYLFQTIIFIYLLMNRGTLIFH